MNCKSTSDGRSAGTVCRRKTFNISMESFSCALYFMFSKLFSTVTPLNSNLRFKKRRRKSTDLDLIDITIRIGTENSCPHNVELNIPPMINQTTWN